MTKTHIVEVKLPQVTVCKSLQIFILILDCYFQEKIQIFVTHLQIFFAGNEINVTRIQVRQRGVAYLRWHMASSRYPSQVSFRNPPL